MSKHLKIIAVVILFFVTFFTIVSAHPGRTDSNGGHTDHSTGKYHYHHGYPAHQHYDMDGNGTKDCPYEYKDKTDTSSHSNSTSYNDVSDITIGDVLKIILSLIPITLCSLFASYIVCIGLYMVLLLIFEGILKRSLNEEKTKKSLTIVGIVLAIIGDVFWLIWLIMII